MYNKPKIIVDGYLESNNKGGIYDYQIYCFNIFFKFLWPYKIAYYD